MEHTPLHGMRAGQPGTQGRPVSLLRRHEHVWAILLAAGDGKRVRRYTSDPSGEEVPKQFWAPQGQPSMLSWTLARAGCLVPPERVITIVAEQHRRWWEQELRRLPPGNVVVQPANRGTTPGILLPVVEVLRRDPRAVVVVLPTDHFVKDESVLQAALLRAIEVASTQTQRIMLLGMEAEGSHEGYGWILPSAGGGPSDPRLVDAFLEKPDAATARGLARQGALLNSFILAGKGAALLALCASVVPRWPEGLLDCRAAGSECDPRLRQLYAELPASDFSRDVLQAMPQRLLVLTVRGCGWSDLGVPERLLAFLLQRGGSIQARPAGDPPQAAAAGPHASPVFAA